MSAIKPLPLKPTVADVATGVTELHACLEEHRANTATALAAMQTSMDALKTQGDQIKGAVDIMMVAFRLRHDDGDEQDPEKPARKRPQAFAMVSQWKAIWTMVASSGGGILLFLIIIRLMAAGAPYAVEMVGAMLKAILAVPLPV